MAFGTRAGFDAVRELAFGSVGASYTAVGTATTDYIRVARFTNTTDVEVYISLDGTTNHIRMGSGSFLLIDFTANEVDEAGLFIQKGTVFYTKRVSGAPTSGAVWIEVISATAGGV